MEQTMANVATCLTVHGTLDESELNSLIHHWAKLDHRLRSFDDGSVKLDLYIKDRDARGQHLTLEATIDHYQPLVATADGGRLEYALNEVRDEMIRLITDARDRHHPRRRRGR